MRPLIGFTLRGVVSRAANQVRQKTVNAKVVAKLKPGILHDAVEDGDIKKVEVILNLGGNPHEPSQEGITPLDIVRQKIQSPPDHEKYKEIAHLIKENDKKRYEERLPQHKIRLQEVRKANARHRELIELQNQPR